MTISAAQVKELRERTGAGMMECKRALQDANGDMSTAIEVLRKSGQAKAAKKAGRIAAEGVIVIKSSEDRKNACMVEVNSETDFAAKDANFRQFADLVVSQGLQHKAASLDNLMKVTLDSGSSQTIAQALEELIAKIGENIQIRRVVFMAADGFIGSYSHGGRIGVLVNVSLDDEELAKDLAMHIAASKPEVISPEDVDAEAVAKEREIYLAQAQQSNKPKEIIEKMVEGKIKKYTHEISLLGQPFVKDPNMTVADLLRSKNAKVLGFVRYEVGEGVEKKVTDFASEVMAQVQES